MGSGNDCGIVLRHALAEADELWRRCVVNGQTVKAAAKLMGLRHGQCAGVVRLLRKVGRVPSPERMAAVAMRDFGLEDQDIAEMFRRSERWACAVRGRVEELREAEPIPVFFEYLDEGLRPQDPCPEELWRRAAEIRSKRTKNYADYDSPVNERKARPQGRLRCFAWNGRNASFLSICPKAWAGR